MKKIASFFTLAVAIMVIVTGCLKDKDFEAQRYGIQIAEVKGVAFPNASLSPIGYGLDVSASPQVVNDLLYVTVEANGAADADINLTITNTTGTAAAGDIAAYNAANGTNVQVLPAALWSIPFTPTILKGETSVMLPLTVTNTTSLDPNAQYGISLTLTSSSSGYQVAANQRNILVFFSVKNKYDGRYRLQGYHTRPGLTNPYDEEVHMITSGPNSVYMIWPAFSMTTPAHPLHGGTTYYGSFTTNFIFNPATDLMTGWDMTPFPTTLICNMTPVPPAPSISRFDPATRTIYAYFHYNNNLAERAFYDVLTYLGPR